MKFLAAKLEENGATTLAAERGILRVRTRSGLIVPLDPCPDPCEPDSPVSLARLCLPRWSVDAAVGELARLDNDRDALRRNTHLSGEGKRAEFVKGGEQPGPLPKALRAITRICSEFAEHESKMLHTQAERYKVPSIGAQSFGEALRDYEIRSVVRSLSTDDRAQMRRRLSSGDDVDLLLATLRSPMPAPDLHKIANEAWRDLRDRNDPAGRAELDLKLATIEWAKRGLGVITGNMRQILSIDREDFDRAQVYELLRDDQSASGKISAAAQLFGYSQQEAANHEYRIARRAAT